MVNRDAMERTWWTEVLELAPDKYGSFVSRDKGMANWSQFEPLQDAFTPVRSHSDRDFLGLSTDKTSFWNSCLLYVG